MIWIGCVETGEAKLENGEHLTVFGSTLLTAQ